MIFKFDDNTPIYIQLVEQLKIHIISGRLNAGDKLPSVRELALQIKVNPNTVQKAMVELEGMDLIYTERTNGKFVTTNQKLIDKYRMKYALEISNNYLDNMKSLGFTINDAINYLEDIGGDK